MTKFLSFFITVVSLSILSGCFSTSVNDFGGDKNLQQFRDAFDDNNGYRIVITSDSLEGQGEIKNVIVTFVRPDTRHTIINSSQGKIEAITTKEYVYFRSNDSVWERGKDPAIRASLEIYTLKMDNLNKQFSAKNDKITFENEQNCGSTTCYVYSTTSEAGTHSTLFINKESSLPEKAIVIADDGTQTTLDFTYDGIVIEIPAFE